MPFPSEVVTRHVTHQYLDPDSGQPCSGTVTFRPSSVMMYPGGTVIRSDIVAILDVNGNIDVEVPVNDSPDINPLNTNYLLIEAIIASNPELHYVRSNRVRVLTGVGPIGIDELIPVPSDDPGSTPIIRGPQGEQGPPGPGILALPVGDPVPPGTPSLTVIARYVP